MVRNDVRQQQRSEKNTTRHGERRGLQSRYKTFRKNVAALIRFDGRYLACETSRHPNWQSVQGGLDLTDPSAEDGLFRELEEELGAPRSAFRILHRSCYWRRYRFPDEFLVRGKHAGQEQLWFLIELTDLNAIQLEKSCGEFRSTKLVDIQEFLDFYAKWKRAPFLDFCYELGLIKG